MATLRSAILASCAAAAAAHVTFKLPATAGATPVALYPNTAPSGGYVPLDSGYLSNSPFMLNVAHAQTGLSTVGLQCKVPQPGSLNTASKIVTGGITVTPAEAAGAPGIKSYDLYIGLTGGVETSFTYSLNSANDPTFPNGWAQPEKDEVNGQGGPDYKTDFFTFIGMSLPSPLGAFTDPSQTAIINGFPHVFFQCAQITVNTSSLLAVNGNYSSLPLYALLWWLTPANVVATCGTYNNTFTGTTAAPLPPALALDFGSPYSPFGGRSAAVVEVASAPHIAFIPANCVGAGCAPPFPSTPFVNAATPTVSSPISVASWTPSPSCNALPGGGYASAYQGTLGVVAVGNGTALSPPPPAAAQPPLPPFALSARAFTAWLISLTVVLSCVVVAALCALAVRMVGKPSSSSEMLHPYEKETPKNASPV